MKKIILFTCIMFLSIDCYSQKEEGNVWREAAKYLYDEGFDRDDLRNTIELVREMSKEFFEKEKFSKKNDKKLKKSFSQEQIDKLKTLSKKMAKLVDFSQKEEEVNPRPNNENFSRGNRVGPPNGARNFSRGNRNSSQQNSPTMNPVFERLIMFIREEGITRENMRPVMEAIRGIGQEYRESDDKENYEPSEKFIKRLYDSGLSEESINIVIQIVKAISLNRK
jgi:glutamyl/glutaminyl-tRNA synthetase